MGEARRRALLREKQTEVLNGVDVPRLAGAIRKLAQAASGHLGSDCYIHSAIAKEILGRLGVEAVICVGEAGFRVGEGDSDVILHKLVPGMPPQVGGVAYHVWLRIGEVIFDPTLYQLPAKCKNLDELDGGHTNVQWAPDYLLAHISTVSTLKDVTQLHAGCYYYAEEPNIAVMVFANAPELDDADVEIAWTLYQNANIKVFGPNDVMSAESADKEGH